MLSRAELRAELTERRAVWSFIDKCYLPICAVCGEFILHGGEIHESLITRAALRDADRAHLILVPENSNLVHTICHPSSGRGNSNQFHNCAIDLFLWEGDGVLDWLDSLEGEFRLLAVQSKRDYLNAFDSGFLDRISLSPGLITLDFQQKTRSALKEMHNEKAIK